MLFINPDGINIEFQIRSLEDPIPEAPVHKLGISAQDT